jgi:hypothetical protein
MNWEIPPLLYKQMDRTVQNTLIFRRKDKKALPFGIEIVISDVSFK